MNSDFQVVAVPLEEFSHLFSLSSTELPTYGAQRIKVDKNPGFPCRVSLIDAEVGEHVILITFTHHQVDSPYKSSGPIFIRENAKVAKLQINEMPLMLHHRLLSIRAYDDVAIMIGAKVVGGQKLEESIRQFFDQEKVAYLHLHNASPGCFNCLVKRV